MANDYTNTGEHYLPVPAITDKFSYSRDIADLRKLLSKGMTATAAFDSNADNFLLAAGNAGTLISSADTAPRGRVASITADTDATLLFQDYDGAALTDKWVIGYDDSSGAFAIHDAATIPADVTTARVHMTATDFHISTGDSGATANGAADDLVVENSGDGGISILVPDADIAIIYMGGVTDATSAGILMNVNTSAMTVGTKVGGGSLALQSGDSATALTLDSSQDATFAGSVYLGTTASGDYSDELVVTGTTSAAIALQNTGASAPVFYIDAVRTGAGQNNGQILFRWDNTGICNIFCATGTDTVNKDDGELHFQTASAGSLLTQMRIDTNGAMHLRAITSDPSVRTNTASIYAKGGAAEMWVQDEAANATQISPHDADGRWFFHSYSSLLDTTLIIHMEKIIRFLVDEGIIPADMLEETPGRVTGD